MDPRILLLFLITSFTQLSYAYDPIIDQIINGYVDTDEFSGSVSVSHKGEILLEKGYGFSIREHKVLNTVSTKYRVGSISKQFTAAAILSLYERKLIALDDKISDYIESPSKWEDITIHHLLTHSSGLVRDADIIRGTRGAILRKPKEIVSSLQESDLLFLPGSGYSYSNSGYTVLVRLIEVVSGKPYPDFLAERLIDSNGMNATGVDHDSLILENKAEGYVTIEKGKFKSCCWDIQNFIGAGSIYSTTSDLMSWTRKLFSGQIFSLETTDRIFTPHSKLPNGDLYYGYGWVIQKKFGKKMIWHDGQVDGFNSMVARWPNEDITIIVLANHNHYPLRHVVHKIRNAIAEYLLEKSPKLVELRKKAE